jgi:CsoR family transcriptional regulator, copper-sensing transcriptional repressor
MRLRKDFSAAGVDFSKNSGIIRVGIPPGGTPDVPAEISMSHRTEPAGEEVAKRLARIAGHAASLKRLWDEGRECDEILTQISAVRAALEQVGKLILEHHIDHCVADAMEKGRPDEAVRDLKQALDRLL